MSHTCFATTGSQHKVKGEVKTITDQPIAQVSILVGLELFLLSTAPPAGTKLGNAHLSRSPQSLQRQVHLCDLHYSSRKVRGGIRDDHYRPFWLGHSTRKAKMFVFRQVATRRKMHYFCVRPAHPLRQCLHFGKRP